MESGDSNANESVGQLNWQEDRDPQPSSGWSTRNILIGIGAIAIMILSLYIILQGVHQAMPSG